MPARRKYIVVNGVEYTGVSQHRQSGRYYILRDGKRQYFRSAERARAAYLADQLGDISDLERVKLEAAAHVRGFMRVEMALRKIDEYRALCVKNGLPLPPEPTVKVPGVIPRMTKQDHLQQLLMDTLAEEGGIPRVAISVLDAGAQSDSTHGPRLSAVIAEWERIKTLANNGVETDHIREVRRVFKRLQKLVGNVSVDTITGGHFRAWREYVMCEGNKRASTKWVNDQHATVKSVFRAVRRHNGDWPWPDGLSDWLDAFERKAYQPRSANRQPLPLDVFRSLLQQCDRWALDDASPADSTTQQGRGQRRQSLARRRMGVQMRAILLLGVNCGLDPVDFQRLEHVHLKLGADPPFLDLPSKKMKRVVGMDIDRRTPLLQQTVDAIQQWVSYEPTSSTNVFRSAHGSPLTPAVISRAFCRLKKQAGIDARWTFKHLRNVGPSLAKAARVSRELREAFLGHVVGGTSVFYEGDVGAEYLFPVVSEIETEYLCKL